MDFSFLNDITHNFLFQQSSSSKAVTEGWPHLQDPGVDKHTPGLRRPLGQAPQERFQARAASLCEHAARGWQWTELPSLKTFLFPIP